MLFVRGSVFVDKKTIALLVKAIKSIDADWYSDRIYDVRERVDLGELEEGQSTWDHPDVLAHAESVELVQEAQKLLEANNG